MAAFADAIYAWRDISVAAVGAEKAIFKNVSGFIPRGGMTAVLGVSSTGKSTLLKSLAGRNANDAKIDRVLDAIGLSRVSDSVIGTILRRGLSGGQKRRVSCAVEIVAEPTILLIDEPTSGLDASTAYALIAYLKQLAATNRDMGVMVTLQQPNTRLMELFDRVCVMGHGGQAYFGPLKPAKEYFAKLGFPCDEDETPTDHYLQVTDRPKSGPGGFDFIASFQASEHNRALQSVIDQSFANSKESEQRLAFKTSQWRQFVALFRRNITVARRDVTLYWLQLMLHGGYGFMVGAVFFSLDPFVLGNRLNDVFNGITWLAFISTYIHVFKTNYLVSTNERFYHEHANHAYGVLPYFFAEFFSTMIGTCAFLPGIAICYFMMGLPSEAFGFSFLSFYMSASRPRGRIFSTGSLIRPDIVPEGWRWAQEVSYYYWVTRASSVDVMKHIQFRCADDNFAMLTANNSCALPVLGLDLSCDIPTDNGECRVSGSSVLDQYKHIDGPDPWDSFGRLVAVAIGFRLIVLLAYYYPVPYVVSVIKSFIVKPTPIADLPAPERTEPAYHEEGETARDPSVMGRQLVWRNLTLSLPNGKILIDNVSGVARGGYCLALMGPSGAGKTTLLNALCGRATYAKVRGDVKFSGRAISRDDLDFVAQFDELSDEFTIRESVTYTGLLKRRKDESEEVVKKRVDNLLQILDLTSWADRKPSALTGGQRKRVSIAIGLVAEASILFLDEPTTGLDSAAAYTIVKYISRIARRTGVTCIMTIHQPSSAVFASLDDLYLLQEGRLAFAGTMTDAARHFKGIGFERDPDENPADFYLDLVSEDPKTRADKMQIKPAFASDATWTDLYNKSPVRQDLEGIVRSAKGLIIGSLYWRTAHSVSRLTEVTGALFMNIWVVLFSVVAGAPTFCVDRRVVQQDYVNGAYRLSSFCVSQFIASMPYTFICALAYEIPLHFMAGFNDAFDAFAYAVLTAFALMLLMEAIVLTVVEGLKNPMLSVSFSMIVLGLLFLFPGFFLPVDDMPPAVSWVPYIIPSTWGTRGSMTNAMRGQTYELIEPINGMTSIDGNDLLIALFKYDDDVKIWEDWVVVLAWVIFWRFVHFGMLWFTNRNFGKSQQTESSEATATQATAIKISTDVELVDHVVDADESLGSSQSTHQTSEHHLRIDTL
ncbi:uncharacterized protein MONBRDRAFT_32401 [Monosiga brevicollis MX1]|uniref:ABC transporter domain-containing protein n=1 Tax=Monosiga brevicollis TaxID=81824 RepID=A9UZA8_MONBE|nr:uncharacterized protein MONBRDRAFT_32401 [Monosiga brevicollis MX1]EDQ89335.1 predicted protein [Monosiga brevicollis MX1]|eukprot:XP_001745911.1 hypothetical protein [Monosiga brevicollis MX1]